jgi:hypothetical protein
MTARIGSPMSLSRKILSVKIPRMNPIIREKRSDRRNGTGKKGVTGEMGPPWNRSSR